MRYEVEISELTPRPERDRLADQEQYSKPQDGQKTTSSISLGFSLRSVCPWAAASELLARRIGQNNSNFYIINR